MQTRPYPEDDGRRVWLSRLERSRLLEAVETQPDRWIALALGLHGLRTDEIVDVIPRHVRELAQGEGHVLIVPHGKTGKRELPIADRLAEKIEMFSHARELRLDDDLIEVKERQVRNWIADAREVLLDVDDRARHLGMHDLRRSWGTDTFYSLAFDGVPIAETLTLSWGGWAQTETGRTTFRQNYLGPVPDHVTAQATEHLPLE